MSLRYLLLGFALTWLPMPIAGIAVVPLLASGFYTVRCIIDYRRAGQRQAVTSNIVGLGVCALLIAMVVAPLVQYERTMAYQKCLWGANTHQARDACQAQHDQHPGALQRFFLG